MQLDFSWEKLIYSFKQKHIAMKTCKLISPEMTAVLIHFVSDKKTAPLPGKIIYDAEEKDVSLYINTRAHLPRLDDKTQDDVFIIAGIVTLDKKDYHYTAHCSFCAESNHHDSWITLIEPSGLRLTSSVSKSDFIKLCKKYCELVDLATDASGNLTQDSFPVFYNPIGAFRDSIIFIDKGSKPHKKYEISTIMCKDHFPVIFDNRTYFGTFIDEYRIHVLRHADVPVRIG